MIGGTLVARRAGINAAPIATMGGSRLKALVFIPLAVVSGLALVFGGTPVLEAFQARPKSRAQLTLVLSIIIGSGALTGLAIADQDPVVTPRATRDPRRLTAGAATADSQAAGVAAQVTRST